ncbi:hypothetical protein WS94_10725 [Burkholderia territorii]|nr:hypothetical protein WS94_10725 [Burkholderia territorii]KWA19020.1 hypothetical protein WT38_23660 [Burkholderia territorii]
MRATGTAIAKDPVAHVCAVPGERQHGRAATSWTNRHERARRRMSRACAPDGIGHGLKASRRSVTV